MTEHLHPVHSSLPLAAASTIIDEAIAARQREKLLPLVVAVLDAGGNLVAFKREDGSGTLRFDIAVGKAAAALGMGMSSRLIRDRMAARPAFQSALAAASRCCGPPASASAASLAVRAPVSVASACARAACVCAFMRRSMRRTSGCSTIATESRLLAPARADCTRSSA